MLRMLQCFETFQFTPLREGRRHEYQLWSLVQYFNSRPSARGDMAGVTDALPEAISIHAPPRGATMRTLPKWARLTFQFTPLREGRLGAHAIYRTTILFQFTPLREGRRLSTWERWTWDYFNSRPSARGDRLWTTPRTRSMTFQFTPLREGRRKRLKSRMPRANFNSRPSARGDDDGACNLFSW